MIILHFFLFYTHAICIQNRILAIPILIHQLICFKYIQDIISFPRESSTRWNVRFGNKLRKTKLLKLLRYILLILSLHRKRKGARYDLHDCKNNTFISFFISVDLFSFFAYWVLWNKGNCVNHLILLRFFLNKFWHYFSFNRCNLIRCVEMKHISLSHSN